MYFWTRQGLIVGPRRGLSVPTTSWRTTVVDIFAHCKYLTGKDYKTRVCLYHFDYCMARKGEGLEQTKQINGLKRFSYNPNA